MQEEEAAIRTQARALEKERAAQAASRQAVEQQLRVSHVTVSQSVLQSVPGMTCRCTGTHSA